MWPFAVSTGATLLDTVIDGGCCHYVSGPKVPHYAQTFRTQSASLRGSPPIAVDDDSFTFHKSAESESHADVTRTKSQSASDAVSYLQRCFEVFQLQLVVYAVEVQVLCMFEVLLSVHFCFQCFDTVAWVSGMASGL